MLHFIFGKAASGKTYNIINMIKENSQNGKESVLIVPEQFTFESERAILKEIGDSFALNTTVLSFSRLCDEVGRNIGGISHTTLSESDKIIFIHKALNNAADRLKLWKKYVGSVNFAKTILETIGEFKINAIGYEEINKASQTVSSETLKLKLHDISIIYQEYDLCIGEAFLDPTDSLTKLYNGLLKYNYFANKTVFLDSFKGFTGQQFKIIERILCQAEDVVISLCYNPENANEYGIFSNIRRAVDKISSIAKSRAIEIAEPIILHKQHYNSDSLVAVEEYMSGGEYNKSSNDNGVTLVKCSTAFDEAEFVANKIRKLIREENYRFRDFVIIARDADSYREAIVTFCNKNGISLYYDNRFPLSSFPLSVFVVSAIKALDFSSENIFKMLKTGLCAIEFSDITLLENYTYIWNISGDEWLKDWEMNPKGFVTDELTDDDIKLLKKINTLRIRAIEPIILFKNSFKNSAFNMANAIAELINKNDVSKKLFLISEKLKNGTVGFNTYVLNQCYELYMQILDSLVTCFGEQKITKKEFTDALCLAVNSSDVGTIPQMLDEVTFGSADRIRPSRPKITFIIGANQGVFPKNLSNAGIFNLIERKKLIDLDINISDNSVYSSIDEEFLVYTSLCCASDKLFISFSSKAVSGDILEPAAFVNSISENLDINIIDLTDDSVLSEFLPETEASMFSKYCRNLKADTSDAVTIKTALEKSPKLEFINSFLTEDKFMLQKDTAKKLYGTKIAMSASKLDTFNRCKFSYFCRYGLGAKKIEPADFNVMQRGTIVHYCLERLIVENELKGLSETELDALTQKYVSDYLNSVTGFSNMFTVKTEFIVSRLVRSLKEVVRHIARELSQSDFTPSACELKIGSGEDEINVSFPFDEGEIILYGSIDRLDTYNGYVRIIDYKTGIKSFKLPDILFGLNMQMLIYLYAVIRGKGLEDRLAAGILYQPSKRDIKGEGLAMNGLLQNDIELVYAMDKSNTGEFVPKLQLNKDGSLSKRANSFVDKTDFSEIFDLVERIMRNTGNKILCGDITVDPTDGRESPACKYCDFHTVCGFENRTAKRVPDLSNSEVFEKMREEKENGI